MKKIAIILPAYNEELTIAGTIIDFHEQLPDAEIVVVNNNSKDRTSEIAINTFRDLKINGRLIFEPRQGKGNAVRRAFMEIDADIYVMSDADLTYPAEKIHELIEPVLNYGVDMVVGDRHSSGAYANENKRLFHSFGNNLVQFLVNKFFDSSLKDIMSGYRVFSKIFVKTYPILITGFEIEVDMTMHALDKKFFILEIPIAYKDRPANSYSKLNTYKDGAKVVFTIMKILRHYRPLQFFSWAAVFFAVASIFAGIPVIKDWILFHFIFHLPLALLATGLALVSFILIAIGLVLDSIADAYKRNFEVNRQILSSIFKGNLK